MPPALPRSKEVKKPSNILTTSLGSLWQSLLSKVANQSVGTDTLASGPEAGSPETRPLLTPPGLVQHTTYKYWQEQSLFINNDMFFIVTMSIPYSFYLVYMSQ